MGSASSFNKGFWLGTLLLAAGLGLALNHGWRRDYASLPPLPPCPVPGRNFVSHYERGESGGTVDAYLFHGGLFGFHEKMARADLLLFGSSHVLFGLSAGDLSARLSTAAGHPVRVFNAALPGTTCGAALLEENGLEGKKAIVDLFRMEQGGVLNGEMERLAALWNIGKLWSNFYRDYLLDPFLPRYEFHPTGPLSHPRMPPRRFLAATLCRNWETGDAEWYWLRQGYLFPDPYEGSHAESPIHPYPQFPNAGLDVERERPTFARMGTHVLYTLLPFSGYRQGRVPEGAAPFLPIAPEGLAYYDTHHLTGAARSLATERLFQELTKNPTPACTPSGSRPSGGPGR